MKPDLINEIETAEILNIKPATLRRWRWLKEGPPYYKIGSAVRYKLSELKQWIEDNTVDPEEKSS